MNELRKDIYSKLLLLGKNMKNISISELVNQRDSKDNIIESDLLTFDYTKQRIDKENDKTKLLVEKDLNYNSKNEVIDQIKNITQEKKIKPERCKKKN